MRRGAGTFLPARAGSEGVRLSGVEDRRARPLSHGAPSACGGLAVVVPLLVLAGWWLEVEQLTAVVPSFETMKPVTAVCLGLLGIALLVRDTPAVGGWFPVALVPAAAGASIGAVSLAEHLTERAFGLDTFLFGAAVRAEGSAAPGRMALITAVCATTAGGALVLRGLGRHRSAHLGGVLVALVAGVAATSYVYDVQSLRKVGPYASVALHTALTLVVIAAGIVLATPDQGLIGLARRGPAPAVLIRRAVPLIVALPLLVGWLIAQGLPADVSETGLGVAIMAIAAAALGTLVLWRAAWAVAAIDSERSGLVEELELANEQLEQRVARRTASLAAQAAVQQASLEALEQGVVLSTLDGEVLLMNRAGRELLGYQADELSALFRSGEWNAFQEDGTPLPVAERPVHQTMDTGEGTAGRIVVWRTKADRFVALRIATEPVRDAAGQLTAVVTALTDVTAELAAHRAARRHMITQMALNADLEHSLSIRDRFLATATHDMRTPITAIVGFANLLRRSDIPLTEEKRADMLEAIERQGHRLTSLVEDILSISVIDGGAVSVEPKVLDLSVELPQIVVDAGREADAVVDAAPGVLAFVDPLRLAQMVTNLLQNAVRYGAPPYEVSACSEGPWVVVRVCDNGAGVDPEFAPRLFERFATAHRGPGRGTGLGLAIVQSLAELHGGEVWHEPHQPSGACFVLRLPSSPAVVASPVSEDSGGRRSPLVGRRLVLAGGAVVDAVGEQARGAGMEVVRARDAARTLDAVFSARPGPDVILIDLGSPGLDGFELTALLRADARAASVPILLLSGDPEDADAAHALAAGADDVVRTPLGPRELCERLERTLRAETG